MTPTTPRQFGVPWTPEEAAAALHPLGDAELLRDLITRLGVPEVEPGRWDAADLLGLHHTVKPWRSRPLQATE